MTSRAGHFYKLKDRKSNAGLDSNEKLGNIARYNANSTLYNSPSFKKIENSPLNQKVNPKYFNQTIMF